MKLKLYDTIKNNSIFFSMRTTTKTFKSLMENQIIEKKLKRRKILSTKTDQFFNMINKAFFKQDIKEKDQDYIYREIKRMQKCRQDLIDLYGNNGKNRIIHIETEPIKYDKKLLFNPYKNEGHKSYNKRYKYENIFFGEEKNMDLPFIFRKKNMTKLVKNNFKGKYFFNKNNLNQKNNISRYNSLNTESSSKDKNII